MGQNGLHVNSITINGSVVHHNNHHYDGNIVGQEYSRYSKKCNGVNCRSIIVDSSRYSSPDVFIKYAKKSGGKLYNLNVRNSCVIYETVLDSEGVVVGALSCWELDDLEYLIGSNPNKDKEIVVVGKTMESLLAESCFLYDKLFGINTPLQNKTFLFRFHN
jgi:hypothetical protein